MEYTIRPYRPGEEQYAADLHRRLYSAEYGWGPEFINYAVEIPLRFARKEKSDREALYVAETDVGLAGCILLCGTEDPDVGQLRIFAVEKACRRHGIGDALLQAAMEKAGNAGYTKLILWTADAAADALRKYEALGFKAVESVENRTWSTVGEVVNEIKMELELCGNQEKENTDV